MVAPHFAGRYGLRVMRTPTAPGSVARAVALLAAMSLGACAHAPADGVAAGEPWPEELRLDGRALVLHDPDAETTLLDPQPARFFPLPVVYTTAVAELARDSALATFGALFRGGAETPPLPESVDRKGFRAVVTPRARSVASAAGRIAVDVYVQVEALDGQGRTIWEQRFDAGTLEGRDDFPPGAGVPRIGEPARRAIDRLMDRAAEATQAVLAQRGSGDSPGPHPARGRTTATMPR